jgi:exonuclease SbcC
MDDVRCAVQMKLRPLWGERYRKWSFFRMVKPSRIGTAAMLSAGNLNTAALTLFMGLHLTVAAQLPWLILDDPVQSMDDVHVANFAALLRTLAKEHSRQVLIAVHDRHLFGYLRLELSPAYPEDSLLALELSRGANKNTVCSADRRSFQVETALRNAA